MCQFLLAYLSSTVVYFEKPARRGWSQASSNIIIFELESFPVKIATSTEEFLSFKLNWSFILSRCDGRMEIKPTICELGAHSRQ